MDKINGFISQLKNGFGGEIFNDQVSRAAYSTDASIYQEYPKVVVIPKDQDELARTVITAIEFELPITPRGSGSSLAGQAIGAGLIIDTTKYLNSIDSKFDPDSRRILVEPGAILAKVNKVVGKHGLMFGPDPASAERATIGGVIGNNATGAHSIAYGMTSDHLLEAKIIQSDKQIAMWRNDVPVGTGADVKDQLTRFGQHVNQNHRQEIIQHWPRTWRNSAGYRLNYLLPWSPSSPVQWVGDYPFIPKAGVNLAALLAGSEGTLGVISAATLGLVEKPKYTVLGILAYKSVEAASAAIPELLEFIPSAIELIPYKLVHLARSIPAYADKVRMFSLDAEAYLVIEFSGHNQTELIKKVRSIPDVFAIADDPADQEKIWTARKVGLGLLDAESIQARPVAFIEDCAIPVQNLAKFVKTLEDRFQKDGVEASYYAHASAGCLHIRPVLDLRTGKGKFLLRQIAEFTNQLTVELDGTMSSEHSDGRVRGEFIPKIYGESVTGLMRELKTIADPNGFFNPGKIIDPAPMDSGLRNEEQTSDLAWIPVLGFEPTGGLVNTIEKCNGQGVCRKSDGVMCPSFQVTKDEIFSTRGRSNLMREYIYQKRSTDEITLDDLKHTLDLCLACKGCKSECPSRVDVAKLKTEFLNYYHQFHQPKIRDVVFANFPKILKLFSGMPWLYNFGADLLESLSPIKKMIGIAEKRSLPRFSKQMVNRSHEIKTSGTPILLVSDPYTSYLEPEISIKSIIILEHMGFQVIPLEVDGLGRTMVSKGFIDDAKKHLTSVLKRISELDPGGAIPIIGLEPSEINILREEIFDLNVMDEKSARVIADRAYFIDEFIARQDLNQLQLKPLTTSLPAVTLHGHCHQKAATLLPDGKAVGVEATRQVLTGFGYEVEVLPTGCCGMAGAFGYEHEHYDFSQQVGELTLFPLLRETSNQSKLICSPGTSCRTQIKDGVQREGLHTMELVYDRLFEV